MSFLKLSKLCLAVSGTLVLTSLVLLFVPGPKFSIEFTGGSLMEVQLPAGKTKTDLEGAITNLKIQSGELGNHSVNVIRGEQGQSFVLRMRPISNDEHVQISDLLKKKFTTVKELQFTTIGPSVSASLKQRALVALLVASAAIIIYLSFSFRKLPRKLSPWKFGVLAVVAFIHDVVLTAGIFVIISQFTNFEFDTLFVTALLTILAYSANDTIVIFDRIRANLTFENRSEDFAVSVERGLRECVTRTINTAMASLIMLFSLYFLGSANIQWFILALIIGTFIGTYSSYFIAAPLLIFWR